MPKTVVGLFDSPEIAEGAVRELMAHGYHNEDISIARLKEGSKYEELMAHDADEAEGAITGATAGAVLGGVGGLLLGLGLFAVPGLGALAAAGPLVTLLTGAGLGAGVGGVAGALTEAGVPKEHAHYYAEALRRGGIILTVRAHDGDVWRADDMLRRQGAIDINDDLARWKSDEQADWGGLPRLDTAPADTRYREREPAVASSATLDRPAVSSQIPDRIHDTSEWEDDFREHYRLNFGHSGRTFDEMLPAYEYGFHAASDPRFHDRDWNTAESEMRQDWSTRGQGMWEDARDAVKYGWSHACEKQGLRGAPMSPAFGEWGVSGNPDTRGPVSKSEEGISGGAFDATTGKRI